MSYSILQLCHSGPGLFGNTNPTSQYGCPMVATKANFGSHFVRFDATLGPVPPPSLSLPFASPEAFGVAAGARTQGSVHGQLAPTVDSGSSSSLPQAAASYQPSSGRGFGAVGQSKHSLWLRARSVDLSNASFNTVRTVTPGPSWLKFTSCWAQWRRNAPKN